MSIQILPAEGTASSNIGAGIGRGLADQLPQEIQRIRMTQGLQGLLNKQGQTPTQTIANLASIPGIDPGLIGVLAPLIQQQEMRRESLDQTQTTPSLPSGQGITQPSPTKATTAPEPIPVGTRREQREGYLQEPTPQEIKAYADNLQRTRPYSFPTEEQALNRARQDLGQDVAADRSYQQRLDLTQAAFDETTQSLLQKDKSLQEGEIGREARDILRQQMLDEMATSKKSPRQLGEEYAKKTLEIARSKQAMRNLAFNPWTQLKPPSEKDIDSLRDLEKTYEKYSIPQRTYIDDLMSSQNITLPAASYIANPLNDTKVGKYMHSLPERKVPLKSGKLFAGLQEEEIAKEIASKGLTNNDLIGSIAYIAQAKGYNPDKLLASLRKQIPTDKRSDQQGIDMGYKFPTMRPLPEIWLMGTSGEKRRASR